MTLALLVYLPSHVCRPGHAVQLALLTRYRSSANSRGETSELQIAPPCQPQSCKHTGRRYYARLKNAEASQRASDRTQRYAAITRATRHARTTRALAGLQWATQSHALPRRPRYWRPPDRPQLLLTAPSERGRSRDLRTAAVMSLANQDSC